MSKVFYKESDPTYPPWLSITLRLLQVSQRGFSQNVIRRRWDCGKPPILICVHLTGIPPHCPTALTLFKKFGGNETDHRSGPPQRTRNFLKKHLVHENFSVTYTRCSLKPASFQKVCLCEYLGLFFLGVGTFFFGVFPCLSGVLCSSFWWLSINEVCHSVLLCMLRIKYVQLSCVELSCWASGHAHTWSSSTFTHIREALLHWIARTYVTHIREALLHRNAIKWGGGSL